MTDNTVKMTFELAPAPDVETTIPDSWEIIVADGIVTINSHGQDEGLVLGTLYAARNLLDLIGYAISAYVNINTEEDETE